MVEGRVERIDLELAKINRKLDDLDETVREMRDILFEMKGRFKVGNNTFDVLKTVIITLLGALLAALGLKDVMGK